MNERKAEGISRRAFLLGGAVMAGSLFLPKIPGTSNGFLLPFSPEEAWADELNGAAGHIMVVGRKQIGIAVGDMGTFNAEDQTLRPISGSTVTIRSYYNGGEVTGVTDESGRVVFDISGLAEKVSPDSAEAEDSNGKKLEYCFNGSITVTREGYRDTYIPLLRFRSVSALIAPTRVFKEGEPYLRQLSFDRWDLQYSKASFIASSDNNETHAFVADVWVPAGKTVKFRLYCAAEKEDGKTEAKEIESATFRGAGDGGFRSVRVEGKFLCPDYSNEAIPVDSKVCVSLECDGSTATIVSGMEVNEPPFVDDTDGEISITPETHVTGEEGLSIATLPESGLPAPLAGSSFSIWKPSFERVMFDFSPLGYIMFGLKIGSLNMANDGGVLDADSWKHQPKQNAKQQFERICKEQQEAISAVGKMYEPDSETGKKKLFSHECSREITLKGGFQMYAQMKYDWGSDEWSGDLNAVIGAGIDASWTIQMVVVVVPVYITFELGAQVSAGLKFAMRSHGSGLAKIVNNAIYNTDESGASVALTISVGLTLGVGVAGVLCAYIRGAGYITCTVMYQASSESGDPRFRLGVGLEATLGVQILLFSWNGTIWSQDWPGLYDSKASGRNAVAALSSGGGMPLDSNGIPQFTSEALAKEMRIVTDKELGKSAEFKADSQVMTLSADGEENTFVEPIDLGDGNLMWDVPAMGGADEDGVSPLAAEDEHFVYLGNSNTGVQLPHSSKPLQGSVGISGVSDDAFGGIKPEVDKCIFRNVFSDPRTKIIDSTMFRIATVTYGNETRTRVVYTDLGDNSWNNPHVVEFDPVFSAGAEPVRRADMYDYDFAITSLNGLFGYYLYLMVISGTRPQGDSTSFAEANSKTVVSVVRLYNSGFKDDYWRCDRAVAWSPKVSESRIASFSCPCIVSYADQIHFDRETNSCVIGACLVRSAPKGSPDKLLSDGAARYLLSFHIDHRGKDEFKVVTNHSGISKLAYGGAAKLVMGPVAFESEPQYGNYDRADRHVHLGIVNSHGAFIEQIKVAFDNSSGNSKTAISLSCVAGMKDNLDVQRLYPTGTDREFYAVRTDGSLFAESVKAGVETGYRRDGRLYLLKANGDGSVGYTPITPVGACIPSELSVSKDGRYLFYVVNKEGKSSRGFTDAGEVGPKKDDDADSSYRVMALARVGNLFTQPFTLAVLDHPLDYIASMVSLGSTATLIGSEITDPKNSIADIHDIRIPLVAVATPLSVATEGPFAFAGEDTVFDVEVRNDGNTILTGATFSLYEVATKEDGSEVVGSDPASSVVVDFQPDLVLSNEGEGETSAPVYDTQALSGEFAASPLASAADNGLLVPGQVQTYKATFRIPASWASDADASGSSTGKRKVRVRLSNPKYLEFKAEAAALLSDDAGGGAANGDNGIVPDNSNADFEDFTEEEWEEFIEFLLLLLVLYCTDPEDWPETEINVLDSGLALQNIDDLHDGESSNGSSSGSGNGKGSGGDGGPNGNDGAGGGDGASAHRTVDTGDYNLLSRLLFGR